MKTHCTGFKNNFTAFQTSSGSEDLLNSEECSSPSNQ